ncbi:type II toxin-antitoxin system PemK/MazF family toxin [Melissospora conviva]|uniref:type II toxin-antitoxin system PemK/MazF family toxin n=1 Tax=Melissospora conviva TaxID=3388432 RepID=UPI003B7E51AF
MKRGEIWTVGGPGDLRHRVVVLSSDAHNERSGAVPFCAPIVRQRGPDLPPFAVALHEADPLSGVVVVNRMRRIPRLPGAVRVGMVTGTSMARLEKALRDFFEV